MNHLETLRYGVANLKARVASAERLANAHPERSIHWQELDHARWALFDMQQQLDDAQFGFDADTAEMMQ